MTVSIKKIWTNVYNVLSTTIYGFYDTKTKKVVARELMDDQEYLDKHCLVLPPDRIKECKCCVCWDSSLYISDVLKQHGIDSKVIYLERIVPKEEVYVTHMATIGELDGKWWWLEYSWKWHRDLHGPYLTKERALLEIKNIFNQDFGKPTKVKVFDKNEIENIISKLPCSPNQFVEMVRK